MGRFLITKRKNEEFQFVLRAENDETVLISEGYKTKPSCMNGVESVRKNAPDDENYERKVSSNGKNYFSLKAQNGQIIGSSEMYESEYNMEQGIRAVRANAPGAEIDDQTI